VPDSRAFDEPQSSQQDFIDGLTRHMRAAPPEIDKG